MSGLPHIKQDAPALVASRRPEPHATEAEAEWHRRPGPDDCRRYLRLRVADALPLIADKLIDAALQGALPEIKLLVQLTGIDEKEPAQEASRPRGKTIEEKLMEDWRKEPLD